MEKDEVINSIFQEYIQKKYFTGSVCLISQNENIIYSKAFGRLNSENVVNVNNHMDINALFDLASITKMFISTIVLRAVTMEKFTLEDKITRLLPDLSKSKFLRETLKDISVKQLLTHTSGIPAWYPFYTKRNENFYCILSKVLKDYSLKTNNTEYSDLNFMLLGEILRVVFQQSLQESIDQFIKRPLNLKALTYGPINRNNIVATEFGNQIEMKMCKDRGLSFEEWRTKEKAIIGEVNDGNCHYYFSGQSGHAGLFSSAIDVLKLGQLYIQKGMWGGERLIDEYLVRESYVEIGEGRGLGWDVSDLFINGVGHTGFTGTSLWIIPKCSSVVVVLTNRLNVKNPKSIVSFRKKLHKEIYNNFLDKGDYVP